MLKIDILTLFPGMFSGPFDESLIAKARSKGLVQIDIRDLRDFTPDKHRKVDDKPFGGGHGMVIKVEPIFNALKALAPGFSSKAKARAKNRPHVVYLSPQGRPLTHALARKLSRKKHVVLLCGHYEGIDERAMRWVDEEISIGDYVLTGGELPAMVLTDAVCRLVPGVVKEWGSIANDSFFEDKLDCDQYTRPAEFLDMKVPAVLLSGNHKEIQKWKTKSSLDNTLRKRPDLLKKAGAAPEFSVLSKS